MVVFTAHYVLHNLPLLVPAILVLDPINVLAHISGLVLVEIPLLLILQMLGCEVRVLYETFSRGIRAFCEVLLCDRVEFLFRSFPARIF